MIKEEELKGKDCPEIVKTGILRLFENILTKDTTFFVTIDAMMEFYSTGKAIVPLIGAIDFPRDKRIAYLRRFEELVDKKNSDKIKVIDSKLPRAAMLCLKGLTIIYLIDHDYRRQKIHFFQTDVIAEDFANEMSDSSLKLMEFNPELWDSYLAMLLV